MSSEQPPSSHPPPALTLVDAAEACEVSKSRIRRLRKAGRFPNAWKDDQHDWLVPVKDLQAVGLLPSMDVTSAQRRPEGDPPPSPPDAPQPAETSISASEQQRREQIVRSIRA